MSEIKDILTAARARITDESKHTRAELARDKNGDPVPAESINAVCWCAIGAVIATEWRVGLQIEALNILDSFTGIPAVVPEFDNANLRPISQFNDTRPHAELLRVFDEAIAAQP